MEYFWPQSALPMSSFQCKTPHASHWPVDSTPHPARAFPPIVSAKSMCLCTRQDQDKERREHRVPRHEEMKGIHSPATSNSTSSTTLWASAASRSSWLASSIVPSSVAMPLMDRTRSPTCSSPHLNPGRPSREKQFHHHHGSIGRQEHCASAGLGCDFQLCPAPTRDPQANCHMTLAKEMILMGLSLSVQCG